MACEIRIIRFRLDEVSIALKSFAPRINIEVPERHILEAHAAPDGTPNALLLYAETETGIAISYSQLAASLIAYCQKSNIPLFREGQKSIQVSKEHIDLCMNMPDPGGRPSMPVTAEIDSPAKAAAGAAT